MEQPVDQRGGDRLLAEDHAPFVEAFLVSTVDTCSYRRLMS